MTSRPHTTKMPRRFWSNWLLLAAAYVITTAGLALALALVLPDRLITPWPWVRTDYALIGACVFMVLTLVVHLSVEQRRAEAVEKRMLALQDELHQTERRRLCALLGVSRIMGTQSDLQSVFEGIVAACREGFVCDQASLMLFDPARERLVVSAASGHERPAAVIGSEKELGEGVAGWVAKNQAPLLLGPADESQDSYPEIRLQYRHLTAAIVVPIILRGELVGVISISSRSRDVTYQTNDLHALEVFAENAGSCIRHAQHAEWMRKTIAGLRGQVELSRTARRSDVNASA